MLVSSFPPSFFPATRTPRGDTSTLVPPAAEDYNLQTPERLSRLREPSDLDYSGPRNKASQPKTGIMVAIEENEQKLLALPLKHRVFPAESLLASVPPVDKELTKAEEMAEVDHRER